MINTIKKLFECESKLNKYWVVAPIQLLMHLMLFVDICYITYCHFNNIIPDMTLTYILLGISMAGIINASITDEK